MPQDETARFACRFDGCNRSFSRQEHLQRHVLNHADGEFTCERCRTVFKRPDLLERHMARHRRKDAEGGTLMTRKRLWKDTDGRVVNRPAKEARKISASPTNLETAVFPPSPPKSASDIAISPSAAEILPVGSENQETNRLNDLSASEFAYTANDDFLWDSSFQPTYDSSYSTGPWDDVFAPDTASSFNMPYTTVNNYNWLFDLNLNPMGSLENLSVNPPAETLANVPNGQTQPIEKSNEMTMRETDSLGNVFDQGPQEPPLMSNKIKKSGGEPLPLHIESTTSNAMGDASRTQAQPKARAYIKEAPMMLLHPSLGLPQVGEIAHERVLDIIDSSRPTMPDGSIFTVEHPFLSLTSLQIWLDLFLLRFNTVYPLVHLPTFEPNETEPILLLSMLLLGATYADKDSHQLAVCIHDVLRPQIFSNPGFTARPELWVLQATLLTECLGKSRAGQKQHDMSHLFHGLLINLIRRSDCQSVLPEDSLASKNDIDSTWRAWAMSEQKKRLAQLCFVWDVQHAVLFSQSLCMSAFELRSTLPCQQNVWEARSAIEWQRAMKQQDRQPPLLLTALKHYLSNKIKRAEGLNLLGHVVLLHGLMSISWDMTRRDQTSLGLVSDKISMGSWKDRMKQAYENWKVDFDEYSSAVKDTHFNVPNLDNICARKMRESLETYVAAYSALYHAAQLSLSADILDLQIYAGARHILGRPVSKVDYVRSQKVVKAWASEDNSRAAFAAWHGAQILSLSLNDELVSVSGDIFHHPWTLFLADLAVWTFYQAGRGRSGTSVDDEMIWDVRDDMSQLLQKITIAGPEQLTANCKRSTAGLTAVVVKHLSKIRWGVIHDGMLVLRGLVQWRLINDDDSRV